MLKGIEVLQHLRGCGIVVRVILECESTVDSRPYRRPDSRGVKKAARRLDGSCSRAEARQRGAVPGT